MGMIVSALAAGLLLPFSAVIAMQMKRIEGRTPLLSMTQFASGSLLSLEFLYLIFFWQAAAFRTDRAGWAVLIDTRQQPVFPRWFGYYQLWVALMFTPGTFNVFFHDGPLAWNGIIAFYLPIAVYLSWAVTTPIMVFRAIRHQEVEDANLTGEPREPDLATLTSEVARLRSDLNLLRDARTFS